MLHHDKGILSEVLQILSNVNANILTINQNIPIHNWASVVISFDISDMKYTIEDLMEMLTNCRGVNHPQLLSIE